jgi:hypothetical protein
VPEGGARIHRLFFCSRFQWKKSQADQRAANGIDTSESGILTNVNPHSVQSPKAFSIWSADRLVGERQTPARPVDDLSRKKKVSPFARCIPQELEVVGNWQMVSVRVESHQAHPKNTKTHSPSQKLFQR